MAEEKKWEPCWLYHLGPDNEPEGVLFVDGPPEDMKGWHDEPGKVKKRGRPPQKEDDD